jgi:hypothetical protein
MTLAQHGDEQQLDDLVLTDDDLSDILFEGRDNLAWIEHNKAPYIAEWVYGFMKR